MQPDEKIILMMKQGATGLIIPDIVAIPDQLIRARLLSFFYYRTEFDFMARFQYWTPPRLLLSGNPAENITRWTNSVPDFIAAESQILDANLYYVYDHSDVQLQAMSSIAAAVLERHQLEFVEGLDKALT